MLCILSASKDGISRFLKLGCLICRDEGIDDIIHIPVQKRIQFIERALDPVIRHTSLREVVGADLLRPVSCTDLTAAQIRLFVMAALHLQIIELCPQFPSGCK